jgi:hypothetical protein
MFRRRLSNKWSAGVVSSCCSTHLRAVSIAFRQSVCDFVTTSVQTSSLSKVQNCLLGCTAVLNNCRPTFQRYVLPPSSLTMEAARISETSTDSYFTRQYIPEDNSELHTRRRVNLKSHFITVLPLPIALRNIWLGLVQPWKKLFMHYLQFTSDNAEPRLIGTRKIGIVLTFNIVDWVVYGIYASSVLQSHTLLPRHTYCSHWKPRNIPIFPVF